MYLWSKMLFTLFTVNYSDLSSGQTDFPGGTTSGHLINLRFWKVWWSGHTSELFEIYELIPILQSNCYVIKI